MRMTPRSHVKLTPGLTTPFFSRTFTIDALHIWSVNNKMKFHPGKCKVIRVTLNQLETPENTPLPFCIFNYQLNGVYLHLDFVDQEKDLGVLVNSKLSWSNHHQNIFSKASSRLGLVKRTCHFTVCPRQKDHFTWP